MEDRIVLQVFETTTVDKKFWSKTENDVKIQIYLYN